jgi:tetratricopeptide (TPR) repeat protein
MAKQPAMRFLGVILLGLSVVTATAHDHPAPAAGQEKLGRIEFRTSCSDKAQAGFESGVALLHSFEYDRAARRFEEVSAGEPGCAIVYWGSAMSLYHQIWDDPSAADLAAGWQFLQKAEAASRKGPAEKAWIGALSTFYRPGSRTVEQRTAEYSDAMRDLHAAYPADVEAAVFYALSLLAAQPPSDTALAYSTKAIAILNEVLETRPDHPGVAHYLIHACDSPALAQQGLAAARRYADLAPSSPHALHMPSHIFTRLGLWTDDIASNLKAVQAAERDGSGAEYRMHPMDFLAYAYLQTGQDDKARAIAADAVAAGADGYGHGNEKYYFYVQAQFPALVALETRNWREAVNLKPLEQSEPGYRSITFWAQAVAAGHMKNAAAAAVALAKLEEDVAAVRKAYPDRPAAPVNVRKNEAQAWLAFAGGDDASAVALLQAAIDYQDRVGKGEVDLPAREMVADMLFERGRVAEAFEQYTLSLKSDPNRFNALYGAGRAAEAMQRVELARKYYRQLVDNCASAGAAGREELRHARQYLAQDGT